MSKVGVEMKDMGQAAAAAPVAAANAVPGYTRAQHIQALAPLNAAIANLGAARGRLDRLAADARGIHPKLHSNFWKQGSKKHHNSAHKKKIDKMESHVYNNLENRLPGITTDLKNAHAAIPPAIDAVRTAHENLRRQHPALAEKSGKPGARTRTFTSPSGVQVSLGNYHGEKHTHPGNGSIVKGVSRGKDYGPGVPHHRLFGGRKTRKHRRKHKRKTRKHKRKRKTKKRKHHRRKHKRKTRRR